MRTRSSLFAALRLLPVLGALACGLTTAQAGTVTAYTALEEDEIKEYLAAAKKDLPGLSRLRMVELAEGLSVQILHVGPYDEEGPVLERLHHEFMPKHQLQFNGKHHEIYLGDPRRAAPEKLKTILRQPVARA